MDFVQALQAVGTKVCKKCDHVLPLSSFGKHKCRRDGLRDICKKCNAKEASIYQKNNREKSTARQKEWIKNHPEKVSQYARTYREKNTLKVSERKKKWRERNRERWRLYKLNRRAKLAGNGGRHTKEQIERLLILQRYKCIYCLTNIGRLYHIDHIRPISKGGSNDISNIQLLCPPCNLKKHNADPIDFSNKQGFLL